MTRQQRTGKCHVDLAMINPQTPRPVARINRARHENYLSFQASRCHHKMRMPGTTIALTAASFMIRFPAKSVHAALPKAPWWKVPCVAPAPRPNLEIEAMRDGWPRPRLGLGHVTSREGKRSHQIEPEACRKFDRRPSMLCILGPYTCSYTCAI